MELETETAAAPLGLETIPEHPERVLREFGKATLKQVMLDAIVELPQVRSGENQAFPDLVASISKDGLNNPPDVAVLSREQFAGVIELNNEVWGRGIKVDDYAEYELDDGTYCTTIAGHTRLGVLRHLQRLARKENPNEHTVVWCKIYEIDDPKEFYRRQLSENFHHTPGKEEQAIAIYHTYMSGLASGEWDNEREFAGWSGIGVKTINEAIAFSKLPQQIIDDVLASKLDRTKKKNPLTFNMAVELGKGAETLLRYISKQLGEPPADLGSEEGKKYVEAISIEYLSSIVIISNGIWNGNRQKGQNSLDYIRQKIGEIKNLLDPDTSKQLTIDDLLGPPESQTDAFRRRTAKDVENTVRKFGTLLDREIPYAEQLARRAGSGSADSSKVLELVRRMTERESQLSMWTADGGNDYRQAGD